jgi:hypothetical protein
VPNAQPIAQIYNTSVQTVLLGGPITFDSDGVFSPGGFYIHPAGSSQLIVTNAGVYEVHFMAIVDGIEVPLTLAQLTIQINGFPVAASRTTTTVPLVPTQNFVALILNAGDVITMHNASAVGILLPSLSIGAMNANLMITKVG